MGRNLGLAATALLVLLAGLAAHSFGFLGVEQFIYVGQLIGGWLVWTCLVAVAYAGLERLFPRFLCGPLHEDAPPANPPA